MSLKVVMPPRNISAHASRVPARTKSGPAWRDSAGQMRSESQRIKGRSSA